MTVEYLKEQAERCRRLAMGTDLFTEKRLLDLARDYEVVREECFPRVIFKRSGFPRRREQGSAPERTIFV